MRYTSVLAKGGAMRIGLVLAGGFAKGAYQLGALQALSEFIPRSEIRYMSTASIGTLNGYAFATDQLEFVTDMWRSFCKEDEKAFITKILRGSALQEDIRNLVSDGNQLDSTFYTALFDIKNKAVQYRDLSKIPRDYVTDYLRASVAFPIYNKSVKLDDCSFYDGGFVDNIPVHPITKHKLDYLICIYFDDIGYKFESNSFDKKIIKITFPNMNNIKNSFFITSQSIDDMIKEGYEHAHKILSKAFANGYEDKEFVLARIKKVNSRAENPKLRLTTDVVITNVNKALSLFAKRKITY